MINLLGAKRKRWGVQGDAKGSPRDAKGTPGGGQGTPKGGQGEARRGQREAKDGQSNPEAEKVAGDPFSGTKQNGQTLNGTLFRKRAKIEERFLENPALARKWCDFSERKPSQARQASPSQRKPFRPDRRDSGANETQVLEVGCVRPP